MEAGLGQEELGAVAGEGDEGVVLAPGGGVGGEGEEGVQGDVLEAGHEAGGVVGGEELVEDQVAARGGVARWGLGGLERAVGEGVRGAVQVVHGNPPGARFRAGPL
jgi:hypothetical protein